jgi:hypothetical protein
MQTHSRPAVQDGWKVDSGVGALYSLNVGWRFAPERSPVQRPAGLRLTAARHSSRAPDGPMQRID